MARRALLICFLTALFTPSPAVAQRTLRVSDQAERVGSGASRRPSISGNARVVAFESTATSLAPYPIGTVQDVFVRDLAASSARLVSRSFDGTVADGPSGAPALDGLGRRVVFASAASNLVRGDDNRSRDVFVVVEDGPVGLVSATATGEQANGDSFEPDISRNGRFVAFTSAATNLVPGDTNGMADIFVKDLATGAITRASEATVGDEPDGPSSAPSIDSSGQWVSFQSSATNLAPLDTNGIPDVYAARSNGGKMVRVSVSTRGAQQNRSVQAPFVQASDISRDGRFVAFESDATNLVRGDRNRDTDVFVHDRRLGRTERVSLDLYLREGNGDSFAPAITTDGRFVAFESFAQNLTPGDRAREDVFVHDRRIRATSIASVRPSGMPHGPERVKQLLQRPSIADTGSTVAFTSTSVDLAGPDSDSQEDVFIRRMSPINSRFRTRPSGLEPRRPRYRMAADRKGVRYYLCFLNSIRTVCPPAGRLPSLPSGRYRFTLRPGGPGLLFGANDQTSFRVGG